MFQPDGPSLRELLQQALSETTRGYDLLATKFDNTPFRTPDALLAVMAQHIGPPGSVAKALDVCCGTGAAMRMLRPLCTDEVVGVDLSQGMLDEAQRRLHNAPGHADLRFVQSDALQMSFNAEFDLAVSCGAFGHILPQDQDRFVDRVRASLVPGGRFVFVTHPMPSIASTTWWIARTFNGVMHVRNALLKPPFIMFYLIFTLERAVDVLSRHGFTLEVHTPHLDGPWRRMRVIVATRKP